MVAKKNRNQILGKFGESQVAQFCRNRGDEVLDRNWRVREGEIDLVSLDAVLQFADEPTAFAVWAESTADGAMVMIDLDGNVSGGHPAEMAIALPGVDPVTLTSGDFALS